jgi:hypothetical protein
MRNLPLMQQQPIPVLDRYTPEVEITVRPRTYNMVEAMLLRRRCRDLEDTDIHNTIAVAE